MASLDREEFPPVVPRQQIANNSFSIQSILNLSEDTGDEVTQAPNHEENRPMFGLPIVPQAIRPVPFTTEGNLPIYNTTQWFSAGSHFPPWLPAGTHFMPYLPGETQAPNLPRAQAPNLPRAQAPNLPRRRRHHRFSAAQVEAMEREFQRHPYVSVETRATLASTLGITETQIKTWFHNRRTRSRKMENRLTPS